jgi:hypothetical protein
VLFQAGLPSFAAAGTTRKLPRRFDGISVNGYVVAAGHRDASSCRAAKISLGVTTPEVATPVLS